MEDLIVSFKEGREVHVPVAEGDKIYFTYYDRGDNDSTTEIEAKELFSILRASPEWREKLCYNLTEKTISYYYEECKKWIEKNKITEKECAELKAQIETLKKTINIVTN